MSYDCSDFVGEIFGVLNDAGLLPQGAEDMPLEQQAPAMLDAVRKLIEAKDVLTLIATQPREGSVPQQVVRMQRIARALLRKLGEAKP